MDKSNNNGTDRNERSGDDRRIAQFDRLSVMKFLYGPSRFSHYSKCANGVSISHDDDVAIASKNLREGAERRSGNDRRLGKDRRCGFDTRTEVERFMQGERRSGVDRRIGPRRRYRSFKKARAFVRGLGLKSESEWYNYVNSGKKPDDIPAAPHQVYASDGWAGWSDWLGASAVAMYMAKHYRHLEKFRGFVHGFYPKGTDRRPSGDVVQRH